MATVPVEITHIRDLHFDPANPRKHNPRNIGMTGESLQQFGPTRSIVIDEDNVILAGNGVVEAAAQVGIEHVRVYDRATGELGPEPPGGEPYLLAVRVTGLTPSQKRQYTVADNRTAELAEWDTEVLQAMVDQGEEPDNWFFDDELERVLGEATDDDGVGIGGADDDPDAEPEARASLSDRFLVPPFSVLDARQGYWQSRKSAWLALGIRSELGRGENTLGLSAECEEYRTGSGDYSASGAGRNDGTGGMADGLIRMRDAEKGSDGNGPARSFGQDLMRGEHTVGGKRLTWVAGDRDEDAMDETSRKILAGGRKMKGRPAHGATVTQNPDGTLAYRPTNADDGKSSGTSVFDPVLCELAYRWFCPPDGLILDPFAGGSVRGIVAHKLGRQYVGIDLSEPQIAANRTQAEDITPDAPPVWVPGDSRDVRSLVGDDLAADLVFSCPPYADLEVYSDDPRDLSTMDYDAFIDAYRTIIAETTALLRDDRFACFVVGDVRDRKGLYRNFVSDTIAAFRDAGMHLYNEAVLVTAVGSLPIRVGRQFEAGRKLGKTHQNVLVFVKGDPRKATEACGPVVIDDLFALVDTEPEPIEADPDAVGDDDRFADLAAQRFAEVADDD